MKNNRIISVLAAALVAVICLSSCSGIKKLKEIDITSTQITSITPNGLTNLNLGCKVGILNPGMQISLSEITCDIKHYGNVLGKVAVDPFTINARTEEIYDLHAKAKLGEDMTIIEAGKLLERDIMDQLTADLHARVKLKGGISKRVTLTDVPLKKLIEFVK